MLSGKAESGGKSHLTQWSPLYIRLCGGKGSAISQRKGQRNQQSQACLRYFFGQKAEVQGAWKRSLERLPLRTDMAEVAGLEPADAGVKVPCLTPWLRPKISKYKQKARLTPCILFNGVGNRIRTDDLQGHNLAL